MDFNEARKWLWGRSGITDGPYANHLHLVPERKPRQHLLRYLSQMASATHFFTVRMFSWRPKGTEDKVAMQKTNRMRLTKRFYSRDTATVTLIELEMWANVQRDGRPVEYRWRFLFNAAVWLTPTSRVPCSNAAKTRNPLKFAGVPQTNETISAGPRLWNSLPADVQSAPSLTTFRQKLKSHLFRQ